MKKKILLIPLALLIMISVVAACAVPAPVPIPDPVGAAVSLASDASDYVTGQILYVDGGVTL